MNPVCAVRLLLLLLLAASATVQVTDINYTPSVTSQPMAAKITSSTFSLGMPICIFYPTNANAQDRVWLVVSTNEAFTSFDASTFNILNRPAFQDFRTSSTFYLTLNTRADTFPCDSNTALIRVLRVGNNTLCATDRSQPDCNGSLPPPGPYRVKFLVVNSANVVTAQTLWSAAIPLVTVKNPAAIDTRIVKRSGGMIVLTTILSILLAILLALTIAVLVYGWSDLRRFPTLSRAGFYNIGPSGFSNIGSFGSMRISGYNTHHMNPTVVNTNLIS